MKIITGSTGSPHVTSNDAGELHQAIFGTGNVVLNIGNHLSATLVNNNTIKISDGSLVLQGRHALIEPGSTEEISIETGAIGVNRHDLIVARYALNGSTGYESITLEVIQGTESVGTPNDPEYNTGDIRSGDTLVDFPLYRVVIEGIIVTAVTPLFTVMPALSGTLDEIEKLKDAQLYGGSVDTIPLGIYRVSASDAPNLTTAALIVTVGVGTSKIQFEIGINRIVYWRSYTNGLWGEWAVLPSTVIDNLTSTATNVALSANQGRVIKATLDEKEDQMAKVSRSGAVTITLADHTIYTMTAITSLNLTGANVSCMGTIIFGSSTPSITISGFTAMSGDDITTAKANETWEFNVFNGRCMWKRWE